MLAKVGWRTQTGRSSRRERGLRTPDDPLVRVKRDGGGIVAERSHPPRTLQLGSVAGRVVRPAGVNMLLLHPARGLLYRGCARAVHCQEIGPGEESSCRPTLKRTACRLVLPGCTAINGAPLCRGLWAARTSEPPQRHAHGGGVRPVELLDGLRRLARVLHRSPVTWVLTGYQEHVCKGIEFSGSGVNRFE